MLESAFRHWEVNLLSKVCFPSMKLVSNSAHIISQSIHLKITPTIMNTPAQARQRGSRSHETGCEALIQAQGERHPQSAKRSIFYTPNHNTPDNVHLSASATRGRRSRETGCEALIQAHGERHPQSAKRSIFYTPNYKSPDNVHPSASAAKG